MKNIIPFPTKSKDALDHALATIRCQYAISGMSQAASDAAIAEVTPTLKKYLCEEAEFAVDIPACGLTRDQVDQVSTAHINFAEELTAYHNRLLGLALCEIAGLVGAKYTT